ncbi:hypothetical protein HN011_003112 [Eciton burchellii]|nr:hypothetical protein HN011_003112 [Eciton burchellii]
MTKVNLAVLPLPFLFLEMTSENNEIIDETWLDRLVVKGRKSPFLVASIISLTGICAYGAYGFKNRKISTQMYLIHLRVAAQGTAIGCLMIGMIAQMVDRYVLKEKDKP